jgi:RNA polymerase II subunit A small phosphatase-like protein
MSQIYEIVIFTASISKYAGPLLDILDKDKFCNYRLFREHCTLINTSFAKDLKKLGRNLKDVIIVDNSPMAYLLNTENGIPILT